MASSKEYLEYILQQLSALDDISCRSMMGEYIIYYRRKIAAYICDDRLLIKPTASAIKMMPCAEYEPPYEGAKDMLVVDNTDRDFLVSLFEAIYPELPEPKKK